MTSELSKKFAAVLLGAALALPAATAMGNTWSKPKSRTRGTAIGAVAGALVAGPAGAVVGGGVGNEVQNLRHHRQMRHSRTVSTTRHYRTRHRRTR